MKAYFVLLPVLGWDSRLVIAVLFTALLVLLLGKAIWNKPFFSFLLVSALLFAAGLLLSSMGFPYFSERFSTALGDALMIASVLGLTVDYFLKERVLRDVSAD